MKMSLMRGWLGALLTAVLSIGVLVAFAMRSMALEPRLDVTTCLEIDAAAHVAMVDGVAANDAMKCFTERAKAHDLFNGAGFGFGRAGALI